MHFSVMFCLKMSSFQALTASLIVHVLMLFWLSHTETPVDRNNYKEFEVVYQESDKKKQQMVEQTEVPVDKLLQVKPEEKNADFLSEKTVRVKEELQAKNSGATANRAPRPMKKFVRRQKSQNENEFGSQPKRNSAEAPQWNPGFSTNDDALPANIRIGDFTALNTDAHLFYTFFARIKDQIRYRWVERVENVIQSTNVGELRNHNQATWQTYIEVVLDTEGRYLGATVMKPSGLPGFDKAAVLAFRDGAPFPNPPHELVKNDGRIYLEYAFQVNWDPSRVTFKQNF